MRVPALRIRDLGRHPVRVDGDYVLYWMIAHRRLQSNFALDRAIEWAHDLGRPLVILEALRCDYPWASDRLHAFVLAGMAEHAQRLRRTRVTYLPYVEAAPHAGRGLLEALAARASVVVTDDFPAFFLPRMVDAAAARLDVRIEAVDSNGLLPMRTSERTFATAFAFRAHVQRTLREHLPDQPAAAPRFDDLPGPVGVHPDVGRRWPMADLSALDDPRTLLRALPIDHTVTPVATPGGREPARARLDAFLARGLGRYATDRAQPEEDATSRLSPYLHFGHLSAHEVFAAIMTAERWTSRRLGERAGGRREGWWGVSAAAEGFLDQLVTWRELGFNLCVTRPDDYDRYTSLPDWARRTLDEHRTDGRSPIYSTAELAEARTHDDVWNAAQRQLVREGWMHNYLRMLWGKKILEWTPDPETALATMAEVMNRFALDGRDPNSWTGYTWTLGRYDRPWAPARPVFGTIRYMSSANTRRKLRLTRFLATYGPDPDTLF